MNTTILQRSKPAATPPVPTGTPEGVPSAPPTPLISPSTWTALRAAFVLLCLTPVTILLGIRVGHLADDPLLGIYGVVVLLTTAIVMFVAFSFYRDPARRGASVVPFTATPLVSCLVACKDDEEVIGRCVESFLEQTYPNLEVIAIDDGSDDGSAAEIERLAEAHPDRVRFLRNETAQGKKRALVRASALARGEYLVYSDSDSILDLMAVEEVVQAFERDPRIGAASGDARALNAGENLLTKIQDTWYDGQFGIWKATESVFGSVSCVSGPLAAFRKEAIWNYLPAWAEDEFLGREFRFATDRQLTGYVLGQRWKGKKLKAAHADSPFVRDVDYPAQDWRVEYVSSARVWTNVPTSLRTLFRQQARWKKSFIRNLCFTGTFYWRRGPMPATLFYSHALFVLATPLMAFRHLIWLPLHAQFWLCGLYIAGVALKGCIWAVAYRVQNPGCGRWIYRPLMSLMGAFFFSMLLIYSALTLRRQTWVRG